MPNFPSWLAGALTSNNTIFSQNNAFQLLHLLHRPGREPCEGVLLPEVLGMLPPRLLLEDEEEPPQEQMCHPRL